MIFKKKRPMCEVAICAEFLPDDPAIIMMDDHEFKVCDNCARLMDTIVEKYEEVQAQRIKDESL